MAYSQNFTALDGTTFTVNIGGVTIPGGGKTPLLADEPFETQEEEDTDMFMPIRTQSGYIRMVSLDKATWRAFIPGNVCAEPVTLVSGGAVRWQGYVQTGTYGMPWPATYEDIELPLVCPLGALDSFDVEAAGQEPVVTLGHLLYYIFSKQTELSFTFYFMQGSTMTIASWLQLQLFWRNFIEMDGDNAKSKFSCLDLLEEICKFFGWTVRCHGQGIYFCGITDTYNSNRFAVYSLEQLDAAGSPGSNIPILGIDIGSLTNPFASNDHTEEYIPGIKSATVNPELNTYDVLVEVPSDALIKEHKYSNPTWQNRWVDEYRVTGPYPMCYRGEADYSGSRITMEGTIDSSGESEAENCYGRLCIVDTNDEENRRRYNWTAIIEILRGWNRGARSASLPPLFWMRSVESFVIPAPGVIYIDGRADGHYNAHARCTLRVGNMYWNGQQWTQTASTFDLLRDKNGIMDKSVNFGGADYDGTGITVSTTLSGQVYFAVHDVFDDDYTKFNNYFPLIDFKIGYVRANQDDDANDQTYTATGGNFPDTVDVDTIFSTDKYFTAGGKTLRCKAGYGLIMSGGVVADTLYYAGDGGRVSLKPEQHTADLIAAYGSRVHRVVTLDLRSSAIGLDAGPAHTVTFDGQKFYPVAVAHQWRENITTLKLMEI